MKKYLIILVVLIVSCTNQGKVEPTIGAQPTKTFEITLNDDNVKTDSSYNTLNTYTINLDSINTVLFYIDSSVTVGQYNYYDLNKPLKICFQVETKEGAKLSFCDNCGSCNTNGYISVNKLENDYIWLEYDLNIIAANDTIISSGSINGLKYK